MNPDDNLRSNLDAVSALARSHKQRIDRSGQIAVLGILCFMGALGVLGLDNRAGVFFSLIFVVGAIAAFAVAVYVANRAPGLELAERVKQLTRTWDPSICGALIDVLVCDRSNRELVLASDRGTVALAIEALRVLVPRMAEEHFQALDSAQRTTIRDCIHATQGLYMLHRSWSEVRAALCRLIAYYGDQADLGSLKAYAHWARRPFREELEAELIPAMKARLEEQRRTDQLLRASEQPAARANELVRPAAGSETTADQLLRPK